MLRLVFALPLIFWFAAASAESIATRYGKISTNQSENNTQVSFENSVVADLEANSISLSRVTPKGRNEYVIIQKWLPGLHCHYEFLLLTIYPNKRSQLSPVFGSCMELSSAQYLKNGVKITLSSPTIKGVTQHHESYFWVSGKLSTDAAP